MLKNSRLVNFEIQDKKIALDVMSDPSALDSGSQPGIMRINNNSFELF
jgi:hypothetical protein